jgi:hypothetical protein
VKLLKDCSAGELSVLVNIVRLAADLHGKHMLPETCNDLEDAVLEIVSLMNLALLPISNDGEGEATPENN